MGQVDLAKRECHKLLSGRPVDTTGQARLIKQTQPPAPMAPMYVARTQALLDRILTASRD